MKAWGGCKRPKQTLVFPKTNTNFSTINRKKVEKVLFFSKIFFSSVDWSQRLESKYTSLPFESSYVPGTQRQWIRWREATLFPITNCGTGFPIFFYGNQTWAFEAWKCLASSSLPSRKLNGGMLISFLVQTWAALFGFLNMEIHSVEI